ncbi:MAG: anaerobic ribonucleoside-triphosphate reductase [Rubrivivax sp.]|nr:anaerobic ribonucleoside-triphosphate reductase [Rubrivivax sp.]
MELQQERATAASAEISLRDDERQRCEVWTRVMGYHRPVASFNIGKQGEFQERVHFVEACVQ